MCQSQLRCDKNNRVWAGARGRVRPGGCARGPFLWSAHSSGLWHFPLCGCPSSSPWGCREVGRGMWGEASGSPCALLAQRPASSREVEGWASPVDRCPFLSSFVCRLP